MIVRPAHPDDAEAVTTVLRRSIIELCQADHRDDPATLERWLANKTPENVRTWIGDPGSRFLVADEEGRVLGAAAIQSSGRISLNYISPDARRRGVSKALVADLEARARALGHNACVLESTRTAIPFYRAIGYTEAGDPGPAFGTMLHFPMRKSLRPGA